MQLLQAFKMDLMFLTGALVGFSLCFFVMPHSTAWVQALLSWANKLTTPSSVTTSANPIRPNTLGSSTLPAAPGRVLCWVSTSPDTLYSRAIHVFSTWGQRCDVLVFQDSDVPEVDRNFPGVVLMVNTTDEQNSTYSKTTSVFSQLCDGYLDRADWFLIAADDTYVIMENLYLLLLQMNPKEPVLLGWGLQPSATFGHREHFSGNASYVLSHEAVKRYAQGLRRGDCYQDNHSEDEMMASCLQKLQIRIEDSRDAQSRERFHCGCLEPLLCPGNCISKDESCIPEGSDCCSDSPISFHPIDPVRMYMFECILYHISPCSFPKGANISFTKD